MPIEVRARLEPGNNGRRKDGYKQSQRALCLRPLSCPPPYLRLIQQSDASRRPIPGLAIGPSFQHSTPPDSFLAEPSQQSSLFVRSRY